MMGMGGNGDMVLSGNSVGAWFCSDQSAICPAWQLLPTQPRGLGRSLTAARLQAWLFHRESAKNKLVFRKCVISMLESMFAHKAHLCISHFIHSFLLCISLFLVNCSWTWLERKAIKLSLCRLGAMVGT